MTKRVLFSFAALIACATVFVLPSALAADSPCPPNRTGGTFDNILVPTGASCTLTNVTVNGNVKALENSTLIINGSSIRGNVDGDKAEVVRINNSTVRSGNIQIKEGETNNSGDDVQICGVTVQQGNIQVEKMTGDIRIGDPQNNCKLNSVQFGNDVQKGNVKVEENLIPSGSVLRILGNRIAQNLQVFKNTGPGQKNVQNNTVGKDLQCKENTPPFVGSPNTAKKKEDQCA